MTPRKKYLEAVLPTLTILFNHFALVDVYTRKTFPDCKTEDVYTRFAALF